MKLLKQFDQGLARGEAALCVVVLLAMIAAATAQAVFRNLATEAGLDFANAALGYLTWVDDFTHKGTLWLAFLGASLATREERHIAIDVLPRIASRKVKLLTKGLAATGACVVSFFLARAFWGAVLVNAAERPQQYEVFGSHGALHVCAASPHLLAQSHAEAPFFFCGMRWGLAKLGVLVETPQAALQLIVPVMFVIIALRLLGHGIGAFLEIGKPHEPELAPPKTAGEES